MNFSIKTRIMIILLVGCLSATIVGVLGMAGMKSANDEINNMYMENMASSIQINQIRNLMRENRIQMLLALQHNPANPEIVKLHDHGIEFHMSTVEKNIEEMAAIWKEYSSKPVSAEEKKNGSITQKKA